MAFNAARSTSPAPSSIYMANYSSRSEEFLLERWRRSSEETTIPRCETRIFTFMLVDSVRRLFVPWFEAFAHLNYFTTFWFSVMPGIRVISLVETKLPWSLESERSLSVHPRPVKSVSASSIQWRRDKVERQTTQSEGSLALPKLRLRLPPWLPPPCGNQ